MWGIFLCKPEKNYVGEAKESLRRVNGKVVNCWLLPAGSPDPPYCDAAKLTQLLVPPPDPSSCRHQTLGGARNSRSQTCTLHSTWNHTIAIMPPIPALQRIESSYAQTFDSGCPRPPTFSTY